MNRELRIAFASLALAALGWPAWAQWTTNAWPSASHPRSLSDQVMDCYSGVLERCDAAGILGPYEPSWYRWNHYEVRNLKSQLVDLVPCCVDPGEAVGGNFNTWFGSGHSDFPRLTLTGVCARAGLPLDYLDIDTLDETTPWRNLTGSGTTNLYGVQGVHDILTQLVWVARSDHEIGKVDSAGAGGTAHTWDGETWADAVAKANADWPSSQEGRDGGLYSMAFYTEETPPSPPGHGWGVILTTGEWYGICPVPVGFGLQCYVGAETPGSSTFYANGVTELGAGGYLNLLETVAETTSTTYDSPVVGNLNLPAFCDEPDALTPATYRGVDLVFAVVLQSSSTNGFKYK